MAHLAIADAGPVIALAKADVLMILQSLFGTVIFPTTVQQECLAKPGEDSQRIQQAIDSSILHVKHLAQTEWLNSLPRSLGDGEKQAISMAAGQKETLLIVDDRLARKQAHKLKIAYIGTARLLDIAEHQGYITSAEQVIETMRENGYRISLELLAAIRSEN